MMQQLQTEYVHQIVVRGMRLRTKVNDIYSAFKEFGEIAACRLIVNERNESKGYCFIGFKNGSDADRAVQTMNGRRFDGAVISVSHSKDQRMGEEMAVGIHEKNQRKTNGRESEFPVDGEIKNYTGFGKKIRDESNMNQQLMQQQQNNFYFQNNGVPNYNAQFQNGYNCQYQTNNLNQQRAYQKDSYDYNDYNNIRANCNYLPNQQYYENNWNNPNNNNYNNYYQRN